MNKQDVTAWPAAGIAPEARKAWYVWKKITDFTEWLWNEYESDFLSLCIEESHSRTKPPPPSE